MRYNKEYGLFIIWSKARNNEKKIIEDIKNRFNIMNFFEINWEKEKFSENLSRFYGENLPKKSFKEKHCGNDSFLLIVVEDKKPLYRYRATSKGSALVNVNFFDSKEMYRNWTGGGHKIHATNDMKEFKHDLMMLLGLSIDDYIKTYEKGTHIIKTNNNIVGVDGWKNLEEIFYVLNETIEYVVLRNYSYLPETFTYGPHGDIDILCNNQYNIVSILGAKKENKIKSRTRFSVKINDSEVFFDFRYLGDNYYDIEWEKNILNSRIMYKCFYVPNEENAKYSLLYHSLIHKKKISMDYKNQFLNWFKSSDNKILNNILKTYINDKNYKYMEPYDISVYFNEQNANKKSRSLRKIYYVYNMIKRIYNKWSEKE